MALGKLCMFVYVYGKRGKKEEEREWRGEERSCESNRVWILGKWAIEKRIMSEGKGGNPNEVETISFEASEPVNEML